MNIPEIAIGIKPALLSDLLTPEFQAKEREIIRLYQAAPEMLQALIEAASVLPIAGRMHPNDIMRIQDKICFAIAKAKGTDDPR